MRCLSSMPKGSPAMSWVLRPARARSASMVATELVSVAALNAPGHKQGLLLRKRSPPLAPSLHHPVWL